MAVFILEDASIRLDELRQTFVVRLVIRLQKKDGHKTDYASGRSSVVRRSRQNFAVFWSKLRKIFDKVPLLKHEIDLRAPRRNIK